MWKNYPRTIHVFPVHCVRLTKRMSVRSSLVSFTGTFDPFPSLTHHFQSGISTPPLFLCSSLSLPPHFHSTPSKPGLTFKASGHHVYPPILLPQQNGSEATKRKQNHLLWKILLGLGRCVLSVCFCSAHKHR